MYCGLQRPLSAIKVCLNRHSHHEPASRRTPSKAHAELTEDTERPDNRVSSTTVCELRAGLSETSSTSPVPASPCFIARATSSMFGTDRLLLTYIFPT